MELLALIKILLGTRPLANGILWASVIAALCLWAYSKNTKKWVKESKIAIKLLLIVAGGIFIYQYYKYLFVIFITILYIVTRSTIAALIFAIISAGVLIWKLRNSAKITKIKMLASSLALLISMMIVFGIINPAHDKIFKQAASQRDPNRPVACPACDPGGPQLPRIIHDTNPSPCRPCNIDYNQALSEYAVYILLPFAGTYILLTVIEKMSQYKKRPEK